jgi:hypothetical protein
LIPYLLLVIYFALSWVLDSYRLGEISASTVGLSHRWIIKSILVVGVMVATVAGIAVWLQVVFLLWMGSRVRRFPLMTLDWPEDAGRVEGKGHIVIDEKQVSEVPSGVSLAAAIKPAAE